MEFGGNGNDAIRANMAKLFRLWEKKRGQRRTGSRLVGGLGEGLFFGSLFVLGIAGLSSILAERLSSTAEDVQLGFGFWVIVLVSSSLTILGAGGFVFSVLQVGASRERRSAMARRAERMD